MAGVCPDLVSSDDLARLHTITHLCVAALESSEPRELVDGRLADPQSVRGLHESQSRPTKHGQFSSKIERHALPPFQTNTHTPHRIAQPSRCDSMRAVNPRGPNLSGSPGIGHMELMSETCSPSYDVAPAVGCRRRSGRNYVGPLPHPAPYCCRWTQQTSPIGNAGVRQPGTEQTGRQSSPQ